jgi:hypothetical protein
MGCAELSRKEKLVEERRKCVSLSGKTSIAIFPDKEDIHPV